MPLRTNYSRICTTSTWLTSDPKSRSSHLTNWSKTSKPKASCSVYRIEYRRSLEKDLRRLSSTVRLRVVRSIQALSRNPRPNGYKVLRTSDRLCRVRVGDYRIIYT